ncbi:MULTISPECIES: hypothetical protein [unclassified Duganella]|uniref:hypothetical protein n=1 Tax=unclassified Duganella TaxID=2636909 RepID=UPI000E351074|nr:MULTISPECIES: hypothetical protein [unclassified Duganella]RFP11344.1 hypothetical protein D0T23_20725 [Duganella sp. BJB475]RFP29663.1 hypothetical protein D0T21_17480 [Duganella sp. BJB476]
MTAHAVLRNTIAGAALALSAAAALAQNGISNFTPSEKISVGTMSILAAPVVSVAASGHGDSGPAAGSVAVVAGGAYVVSGIAQSVAGGVEVVLTSVGSAAKLSVKLAGKTVDAIGLSVGTTVQVVSETTGTLLVASGKVVAFIPNALGEALLSQKRLPPQ